jgi:uncharacterized membrane protein
MRMILSVVGILAILMGLMWVGQGTGYVPWPKESFMIAQMQWAYYGAGLALFGLLLLFFSRRG